MAIALVCSALLGILVFGLGLAVSLARMRTQRGAGYVSDPKDPLHKLVRAHGNTSEYAAMLAVLFLLVATQDPPPWALWSMMGATTSRYLLAFGLIVSPTLARPHPIRFVGALGTYVCGLALCAALLRAL
ncbi:MAG: MAPEG family protein [Myxococcales bacterium]|nr:MAPEG family protein [Myxococcales bacterium]MDH5305956.1 MAPEG family protein [Myxococcales bacterium]MDH5567357.1 MAPEG family protein [Myxococcales bacterium]